MAPLSIFKEHKMAAETGLVGLAPWAAWLAPVPIIGIWFKSHLAQNQRIREAHEIAAKAEANTAKLKEEIASCKLGIHQDFAQKGYIKDVEHRLTKRIETMENRLISALSNFRNHSDL